MKASKNEEKGVDVLYRVDPKKLSIKLCYTSPDSKRAVEYTTTFENFSLEKPKVKSDFSEQVRQLPAFINGAFYCKTEEEAQHFIRTQIGM